MRTSDTLPPNAKPLNGRLRYVISSRDGRVVRRTPGKRVPSGIQGSNPCPGASVAIIRRVVPSEARPTASVRFISLSRRFRCEHYASSAGGRRESNHGTSNTTTSHIQHRPRLLGWGDRPRGSIDTARDRVLAPWRRLRARGRPEWRRIRTIAGALDVSKSDDGDASRSGRTPPPTGRGLVAGPRYPIAGWGTTRRVNPAGRSLGRDRLAAPIKAGTCQDRCRVLRAKGRI